MSADYSPSDSVVAAHNIPHMDMSGGSTSNEFDATDTEYLMSLLCFPILIGCIGIFALFFYQFIYCCFCCSCCKTVDKLKKEEVGTAPVERIQKIVLRRQHLIYMFFTVLLGIIICDQLFVSYNENFTSGVNTMGSAFDDLSNTTHVLVNATDDISYSTNLVAEQLTLASTGSCPANDPDINNMLQGLSDNAAELSDLLSPVPGSIDDGKESMKLYLIEYKNGFIFTGYALILVLAAVYLIAYFLKSRTIFRIWGALTGILILVLIITCTIIMIVVMLFGDYCMEPTDNLLKYFDGSDEYDLLNYYFRCAGSNPVEEYQTDILSFATDLEDALLTLLNEPSSPCHGNTHLETAINEIGPIFDNVGRIVSSMSCAPVQNAWIKVIETGFCTEIMDGVYPMWVVVYLTTAFIFLLNIISDVLSQYFEEHLWKLDPVNRVTQNEMAHSDPAQVGGTVEEGAKMDIVVGNNSSNANVEMTNL